MISYGHFTSTLNYLVYFGSIDCQFLFRTPVHLVKNSPWVTLVLHKKVRHGFHHRPSIKYLKNHWTRLQYGQCPEKVSLSLCRPIFSMFTTKILSVIFVLRYHYLLNKYLTLHRYRVNHTIILLNTGRKPLKKLHDRTWKLNDQKRKETPQWFPLLWIIFFFHRISLCLWISFVGELTEKFD